MNSTFQFGVRFRLMDINPGCMYLVVPIQGYIFPVLAVLASVVNILAVIVFLQPRVRSHTTFILTLIACTDTLNILFPAIFYVYYYSLGHYKEYMTYKFCFLTYIFGDISVEFFNGVSLWLTVLLAYIRCRCIKSPFNARNIHTSKRIATYIALILILTIIYHLPSLFLYDFSPVTAADQTTNTTTEFCVITESNFIFQNSSIGRKLQFCAEVVLDSAVPCFILVYLDFGILLTLREAKQTRISLRRCDQTKYRDANPSVSTKGGLPCGLKMKRECFRTGMKCNIPRKENQTNENSGDQIEKFEIDNTKPNSRINRNNSSGMCTEVSCLRLKWKLRREENTGSIDAAFNRLDRECRRTSWLILMVATIISLHEISFAITKIYILVKHAGVSLPLNVFGCLSVFLLLWQYVTYLVIFLIYAFMSGAFRTELTRILTSLCKHELATPNDPKKVFLSPCSVRKTISRDVDATADFHDSDIDI